MGIRDAESVGRRAIAKQLAIDLGASGFGMFQLFENDDCRPFAQDESVAILVEWTGGSCRGVVASTQRREQVEAGAASVSEELKASFFFPRPMERNDGIDYSSA